jgi:hypothetical protein
MIPKFKNDKERLAFLDNRDDEGWYLWKEDDDINRKIWRYDYDDCAIVVEEQLITHLWPEPHVSWATLGWYIIDDWHKPFADGKASRTLALAKVKEEEKKNDAHR